MRLVLATLILIPSLAWAQDPAPATPAPTPAEPPPVAPAPAPADPMAEADTLWAGRVDAATLEKALAKYDEIAKADPANRKAYERLARGWYFYGDAFTDDVPTKLDRWAKSLEYSKSCLALNADYKARIDGAEKEKDAIVVAKAEDVPCIYWYSTALGKWAKAQSLSITLKNLPTVKAFMTKAEELDPTFFNYGPSRYWGAYYAALPSFAGKDLVKSEEYFKGSIEGAPDYLATRVLRAEMLAVEKGDRKMFEDDLNYVISADPNKLAECAPENTKEQEKAKKLLAKGDELFLAATPATTEAPADDGKKKKEK